MTISPKGWTADALVLLAALIWGVAFYFQKSAMDHVGPLTFLGLRAIIAAAALLPFALMERRSGKSVMPVAMFGGCIFFVAASIQQIGIVEATVTNTGFLTALYVVFTPFIVWALRRKAPGAAIWIGDSTRLHRHLGAERRLVCGLHARRLADCRFGDLLVMLHRHHRMVRQIRNPSYLYMRTVHGGGAHFLRLCFCL